MALLLVPGVTVPGTTPIHIETEAGGDVDTGVRSQWDGQLEDTNGALFWNGSKWVSNSTAAHAYFTDLRTGQRLKEYTVTIVDSSTTLLGQLPGIPAGYTVTKRIFAYRQPAVAGGGEYAYQAVEYEIAQPDGTRVLLRSRGTGSGTAQAHFDAYIEDGKGNTTAKLTCTVTAGTKSRTTDVPAGAYAQLNDIGTWLGVPAGWTTITVKGNGRWSGTISTIDPYTGDPTTVWGTAR